MISIPEDSFRTVILSIFTVVLSTQTWYAGVQKRVVVER